MIDPPYSRQRDQEDRAAMWARQRRMIIPLVAALILLGGGLPIVWGFALPPFLLGESRDPYTAAHRSSDGAVTFRFLDSFRCCAQNR